MTSGFDGSVERGLRDAARTIGDESAVALLSELVRIAPTNLEDPPRERYEKPNYRAAADRIAAAARELDLEVRRFDPVESGSSAGELRGISRPNVVIDLPGASTDRVLVLAHFDVVPVPAEQRSRWKTDPHTLTPGDGGRLFGRGANDDLGSGIVASLVALGRLRRSARPARAVRLIAACDEETGGEGGVEAIKDHDASLPPGDPKRILDGSVALIPDGSPHAVAGSSGVAFLDAGFRGPTPLASAVEYGETLRGLHEVAHRHRSRLPSPDWPDHGDPDPVITGRATVTKFDFAGEPKADSGLRLVASRAEADAANQIPEAVSLVFAGPPDRLAALPAELARAVTPPFTVRTGGATSLPVPPGSALFQVVGKSAHAGYPHRGHNPVPPALHAIQRLIDQRLLDARSPVEATFAVDLRLIPESPLADGRDEALEWVRARRPSAGAEAWVEAPPARCRRGYSLDPSHPEVVRLAALLAKEGGETGIFGEHGGTDASSLADLRTPSGSPLPAIVFGSMDRAAQIHDANESVDPRALAVVARVIEAFVRAA